MTNDGHVFSMNKEALMVYRSSFSSYHSHVSVSFNLSQIKDIHFFSFLHCEEGKSEHAICHVFLKFYASFILSMAIATVTPFMCCYG